jgi:hypothetical protein
MNTGESFYNISNGWSESSIKDDDHLIFMYKVFRYNLVLFLAEENKYIFL